MHRTIRFAVVLFAMAGLTFAASIGPRNIYGNYVEARTADVYTGPCFANSEVGLVGQLAVFGWKVTKGSWQGVDLDGLGVAGVVRAHHTLGDVYETAYPVQAVMIVDSRASLEQRIALQSFARHMAGDLLSDVVRVDYQPVDLTFAGGNVHSLQATLKAGNLAEISTRAMNEGDQICRNEEVWYRPLTNVDHAMPAYAIANRFDGQGLGTTWSSPDKRSSFVGTFNVASE